MPKIKKNGFKKISDELMFKYSNLGFLSILKEFKSLLSSTISWTSKRINYLPEFAFRNWMSGVYTRSNKVGFETMFFPLMWKMEYAFLKGSFTYALKTITLTKNGHAWFCKTRYYAL